MPLEERVTHTSCIMFLKEGLEFAFKPGSLIRTTRECIENGADDVGFIVYPIAAFMECARVGAYYWGAYKVGEIISTYF